MVLEKVPYTLLKVGYWLIGYCCLFARAGLLFVTECYALMGIVGLFFAAHVISFGCR